MAYVLVTVCGNRNGKLGVQSLGLHTWRRVTVEREFFPSASVNVYHCAPIVVIGVI